MYKPLDKQLRLSDLKYSAQRRCQMEGFLEQIAPGLIMFLLVIVLPILVSIKMVNRARKDSGYQETFDQLMEMTKKKKQ